MVALSLNLLGLISLCLAIRYWMRLQTSESLDEASYLPFADDPEVAKRVEAAIGKPVSSVAPECVKKGWINMEI